MRFSLLILLLLCFCSSSPAAPPSSTVHASSPTRLRTFSTPQSSSSDHASSTRKHPHHPQSSPSNEIHPHPRPTPVVGGGPGRFRPRPTFPKPPLPAPSEAGEHREHHSSQKPITIFFEVLGGLVGLVALASCFRCCYHYNRTPKRDRISAILERHQLERELAELDRNPLALRRSATSDPLPVYFPPPPTYETAAQSRSACAPVQRDGYTEVATTSPSSSPTSSPQLPTRQLESAPATTTIPRPSIPSVPDG